MLLWGKYSLAIFDVLYRRLNIKEIQQSVSQLRQVYSSPIFLKWNSSKNLKFQFLTDWESWKTDEICYATKIRCAFRWHSRYLGWRSYWPWQLWRWKIVHPVTFSLTLVFPNKIKKILIQHSKDDEDVAKLSRNSPIFCQISQVYEIGIVMSCQKTEWTPNCIF